MFEWGLGPETSRGTPITPALLLQSVTGTTVSEGMVQDSNPGIIVNANYYHWGMFKQELLNISDK